MPFRLKADYVLVEAYSSLTKKISAIDKDFKLKVKVVSISTNVTMSFMDVLVLAFL